MVLMGGEGRGLASQPAATLIEFDLLKVTANLGYCLPEDRGREKRRARKRERGRRSERES